MLARLGREHKTQEAYIRAVRNLAGFLGRSPDTATVEDLRRFQLHLVDRDTSPITLNATLTGLKFFFCTPCATASPPPAGAQGRYRGTSVAQDTVAYLD